MNRLEIASFKERVDLVKVVGHFLTIEKKGAAYQGLCPFHDDHHPSLRVDPVKGVYHCFSCGAGGDVFRFVQEKEGCGFSEAVRICADICRLSVPVPDEGVRKQVKQPAGKDSSRAVSHLAKRQTVAPTVEENRQYGQTLLSYDPGMEELVKTYVAFGVGIAPTVVPDAWKFTRGRIVFPIHNAGGELVAFAARYKGELPSKKIAKYLNSETCTIYKKDELLYGWHRAVETVRETGVVFLTEGYKDTLAMHAAGFTNTVAICGTNLSEHHIAMLRKVASTVCLFLDADEAGRKTVAEVIPKLYKAGLQVVDILPERGKDADEMFRLMGREVFIRWVKKGMLSPARRRAESLLVAACHRWPDTCCLTEEGEEVLYVDSIRKILSCDDLLPEDSLVSLPDAELQSLRAEDKELDKQYALHTDPLHSDRVRRSELVRYLFLGYLEVRLVDRVRQDLYRLSRTFADEESRVLLLSDLQYQRNYLSSVSCELGRR